MRSILLILLALSINEGYGQFANTYFTRGGPLPFSGVFVEKDPIDLGYYMAGSRGDLSGRYVLVSKVNPDGSTVWHKNYFIGGPESGIHTSLTDFLVTGAYMYASVLKWNTPNYEAVLYRMDFDGILLDSSSAIVVENAQKMELSQSSSGDVIMGLSNFEEVISFWTFDPITLTAEVTPAILPNIDYAPSRYRGVFCEGTFGYNCVAVTNEDQIDFAKLNNSGDLLSTFSIPIPNGEELADFEFYDGNMYLLVNGYYAIDYSDFSPLHLIKCNLDGVVEWDVSFPYSNNQNFTNLCVETGGGNILVSSVGPYLDQGTIYEVSGSGSFLQEFSDPEVGFYEIQNDGVSFVASGHNNDNLSHCFDDEPGFTRGQVLLKHPKEGEITFETVSPSMSFAFNNILTSVGCSNMNFLGTYKVAGAGSTIYSGSLWMTGQSISGDVSGFANQNYKDQASGPITNSADYIQSELDQWQRVWRVSREDIDAHIITFTAGIWSYEIPDAILHWPGNGDPSKGQSEQLAPYRDLNENGIYEPTLGEYPLIKGDYCVFSLYNDFHSPDLGCWNEFEPYGVEVYEFMYGFDCPDDSALMNTTFLDYYVINKSSNDYYSNYIGYWSDTDIDFAFDDYIGCDVQRGFYYTYDSWGDKPTEQGVLFLGAPQDVDGVDNAIGIGDSESLNGFGYGDGIADNERQGMTNFISYDNISGAFGDPNEQLEYHNYLRSYFAGGDQLEYGSSGIPTKYAFPGDTDPLNWGTWGVDPGYDWSEESEGSPSGDRRGVGSSGGFTMMDGDTVLFSVALVTGKAESGSTSHEVLVNYVDLIRSYKEFNLLPCGQTFDFYEPEHDPYTTLSVEDEVEQKVVIYPNPNNGQFLISGLNNESDVLVYDLLGRNIQTIRITNSTSELQIDGLSSGTYLVVIQSQKDQKTFKVTVN